MGNPSISIFFIAVLAIGLLSAGQESCAQGRDGKRVVRSITIDNTVELSLFWEPGCPYCQRAKRFLADQIETRTWLKVNAINIADSSEAQNAFLRASRLFGIERPGVPLIIVGRRHFLGFDDADGTGHAVMAAARSCREQVCDTLAGLLSAEEDTPLVRGPVGEDTITIPWLGPVHLNSLSLPALTVVLAGIDGFNPCAMWVLIFLVGLLVGMQDRARMWLLGGAFLLTSGLVYFGFLAAWLNVFLILGAIIWVRVAVGFVALASGVYYLHAFATDAAAECRVTNPVQRRRITSSLRASVSEKRFLLAVAGIVTLAAAVNLIELICSAGIPAVYTDVLAMSNLPVWQYYLYLLLYVAIFMLDDTIIFALAMMTLHATSMTNRYLRVSHLLGGVIMLAIGGLLLFAPQWLTFRV